MTMTPNTPVAGLPAKWRDTHSRIVRALAAIVNAPQTDAQLKAEVIPRDFVMARLMDAKEAYDELSAALASPAPSAGVGDADKAHALADELKLASEQEDDLSASIAYADTSGRVRTLAAALQPPAAPSVSPAVGGPDLGLVAEMLDDLIYSDEFGTKAIGQYTVEAIREQARLCREADNATGDAVTVNRSPAGEGGLPSDALIASLESRDALRALARTLRDECRRLATAEQPGSAVQADRELIRRLYIELLWCDRQLVGRGCKQGGSVRDALADALAYLKATPAVEQVDDNLPGMWSHSDFAGGDPDERSHAARTQPEACAAPSGVRVDDAMVASAADALVLEWNLHYPDATRMAKCALTAALAGKDGAWSEDTAHKAQEESK